MVGKPPGPTSEKESAAMAGFSQFTKTMEMMLEQRTTGATMKLDDKMMKIDDALTLAEKIEEAMSMKSVANVVDYAMDCKLQARLAGLEKTAVLRATWVALKNNRFLKSQLNGPMTNLRKMVMELGRQCAEMVEDVDNITSKVGNIEKEVRQLAREGDEMLQLIVGSQTKVEGRCEEDSDFAFSEKLDKDDAQEQLDEMMKPNAKVATPAKLSVDLGCGTGGRGAPQLMKNTKKEERGSPWKRTSG
eukprot:TRINITY_DN40034_c0_g1_i1.p1 TRINITY_DN40034_c0_g1~~TRINITY_DN40034_c0_g1_i1.p1  ORF type:complete len:246 (-),score=71.46 TRINITY_DN40034_c0_g1_i1:203-940(-)